MLNSYFLTSEDIDDEVVQKHFRRMICFTDDEIIKRFSCLNPKIPIDGIIFPCEKSFNGKCNMMECMCFEDENDDENADWYLGYCKYCEEDIEGKDLAYRIPLSSGGFRGCFCSGLCMHSILSENSTAEEHILIELLLQIKSSVEDEDEDEDEDKLMYEEELIDDDDN